MKKRSSELVKKFVLEEFNDSSKWVIDQACSTGSKTQLIESILSDSRILFDEFVNYVGHIVIPEHMVISKASNETK
jgi:hypothetical protein